MIIKVAFDLPTRKVFDYFGAEGAELPKPGCRVLAKLGNAERIGIVMEISSSSELPISKIRQIEKVLDGGSPILPKDVLEATIQVAAHRVLPVGKLVFSALPPYARKNTKDILAPKVSARKWVEVKSNGNLKGLQSRTLASLFEQKPPLVPHLVSGVPGTGKSEVCLEAIATCAQSGKSALALVPEIKAIEEWKGHLEKRMPGVVVAVAHSSLSAKERMDLWWKMMAGEVAVLVGTRSAVFMPLANPGLICVINENNPLYRFEGTLNHSARDMAAIRAKILSCPLLMSSATPSIELRHAAQSNRIKMTMLSQPTGKTKPNVQIIDIANRRLFGGVSVELENALRKEIQRGGQSFVLVNKRGGMGLLFCNECRLRLQCKHCGNHLSSKNEEACFCGRCGHSQAMPKHCPGCGSKKVNGMRPGSVRVAESLATRMPEARILRIDPEMDQKELAKKIGEEKPNIIVGNTLLDVELAFGTCCVSDADSILFSRQFRAAEYLLDTLTKLTAMGPEVNLVVQTRFANHHVFEALRLGSYDTFAFAELSERKSSGLAPFRRLALLTATGKDADSVAQFVGSAKFLASECMSKRISILEPVPTNARKDTSTMQLLVNSPDRKLLQDSVGKWAGLLEEMSLPRSVEWNLEVDPEAL